MKTSKRICKNGSITLPKQIRGEAGLFPGNAVDIETSTDGTVTIKPSAPAKRMLIGLWKGNFVRCTIKEVIEQMNGVSEDERKQLIKKCKGINYDKDVNNILKFTNISEDDAREYAYLISEAAVWQDFKNLLTVNGMDESHIDDILMKIQSSFVVEDSTKISLS